MDIDSLAQNLENDLKEFEFKFKVYKGKRKWIFGGLKIYLIFMASLSMLFSSNAIPVDSLSISFLALIITITFGFFIGYIMGFTTNRNSWIWV